MAECVSEERERKKIGFFFLFYKISSDHIRLSRTQSKPPTWASRKIPEISELALLDLPTARRAQAAGVSPRALRGACGSAPCMKSTLKSLKSRRWLSLPLISGHEEEVGEGVEKGDEDEEEK